MRARAHRPPRRPSVVDTYLQEWADLVRRAERTRPVTPSGCPCCDGEVGLHARDSLEAVIRRGGKHGRRVAAAVAPLDARFAAATVPVMVPSPRSEPWRRRTWF